MLKTLGLTAAVMALVLGAAAAALATTPGGPPSIPEPGLLVLVAAGVGGAVLYARSRRAGR